MRKNSSQYSVVSIQERRKKRLPTTVYSLQSTGFTLLELLIALSISSIIFLVIISTYSLTMNTLGKWDNQEENYYLARNIFRRMHDEISSLYPISDLKSPNKSETSVVEGDEKTFSFYTTAKSLYFPFSCLIRVTYKFITNDEGENFLIREEKPYVNFSLEEKTYIKSYVWSTDLKDFSFQYSDGKQWYDSWNSEEKNKIPQALKIVLVSPHEQTFSTIIYIPTGI